MKYDYHHVSPEHAKQRFPNWNYVPPEHYAMHDRLINWATWLDPRASSQIAPMFRLYKSKARQWHEPSIRPPLDTLDAIKLEQAVRALPMDQCEAIRWCYVRRTTPARQIRAIGCTYEGLYHLIQAGRGNLAVRLSATRESTDRKMLVAA